jgi:ABC-type transport system involved in multi-copper enzyme maturation permease subunit
MSATLWNSLREAVNRRVFIVLLGVAIVTAGFFNLQVKFGVAPNGVQVVFVGERNQGPWPLGVPTVLGQLMVLAGLLWTLLTIVAASPLLTATLDKGWVEVIFTKGIPRSSIMFGRFLAGVALYAVLALASSGPLALRLWWVTGLPTWQVIVAVLLQMVGFSGVLSVSTLVSLLQKGVALPMMAGIGIWYLSSPLATREETYYPFVKSALGRQILDWVYYILPKCSELDRLGTSYIQFSSIPTLWPLWTTLLFTIGSLALTMMLLERKSF